MAKLLGWGKKKFFCLFDGISLMTTTVHPNNSFYIYFLYRMNEYELSQNKQLTSYDVKDLNADCVFPYGECYFVQLHLFTFGCQPLEARVCANDFVSLLYVEDESFDKVTCVVSVDYLNQPQKVFDEIARVLRPGGEAIISMSNRCFPTKAFRIWLQTNDLEHIFIVGSFFHFSGKFEPATCEDRSPNPGRSDPLFIVKAAKKSN